MDTHWPHHYSTRFNHKLNSQPSDLAKYQVRVHAEWIANQPRPGEVLGQSVCHDERFKKVRFDSTGWVLVYVFLDQEITFLDFYSSSEKEPW